MEDQDISLKKSTTDRSFHVQDLVRAAAALAPDLVARLLTDQFFRPHRRVPSAIPDESGTFRIQGRPLRAEVLGEGPLVVLVHGWSGSSSQLVPLRDSLVDVGFRVAWFDAPGHGASPGRRSHLGHFVAAVEQLIERHGPAAALVGHSLGGLATAIAARRFAGAAPLILFAPLPSFDFALDHYQTTLGFQASLRQQISRLAQARAGLSRHEADLAALLPDHQARVLLCHDQHDRHIPAALSRALAAPLDHVEYVETRNLGHRKVLSDRGLLACATEFLVREVPAQVSGSVPPGSSGDFSALARSARRLRSPLA